MILILLLLLLPTLPSTPHPQTVEAMTAILDDLTIDDHFSIIDFNHNVRCWSEELVPASTIQIADAKRYVQRIKPNGGPGSCLRLSVKKVHSASY